MAVKPIPEGYHTVTPYLVVKEVPRLLDFLKKAFGAQELVRMGGPKNTIMHAEVRIGDSIIMMGEASDQHPPMPAMINLYVPDVDTTFNRAVEAGGSVMRAVEDQFYGDRAGGVKDPTGNHWWVSTHKEDVPPEEMERRMSEMQKTTA